MVIRYELTWLLKFQDVCVTKPEGLILPDYKPEVPHVLSWRQRKHGNQKFHGNKQQNRKSVVIKKPPPTFSKKDLHAKILSLLNKLGKSNVDSTYSHVLDSMTCDEAAIAIAGFVFEKMVGDEPTLVPVYLSLCQKLFTNRPFKESFMDICKESPWASEDSNEVPVLKIRGYCVVLSEMIRRKYLEAPNVMSDTTAPRAAECIFKAVVNTPDLMNLYMFLCDKFLKNSTFKAHFIDLCKNRPWLHEKVEKSDAEVFSADYYAAEVIRSRYRGYSKLLSTLLKRGVMTAPDMFVTLRGLVADVITEPETLESLCDIVTDCGILLDRASTEHMDDFISCLQPLTKDTVIPVRMRFKVMDIIDLRNRKWVPKSIRK